MIPLDLSGKRALVTGASQGLGATTAEVLHAAGAEVIINHFPGERDRANAEALVQKLGTRASAISGDVSRKDSVAAMASAVAERFGSIDILVNNAGIARDRTVAKMTDEEWEAVINTNLNGVFYVTKALLPLLNDGGRIINVSSVSALLGLFGQANYAAAKAGILGFTRTLSRELGKRQITVNAIAPGLVLTELGKTVPEPVREQWLTQLALKRFGEPEEIAHTILFLASPLASYITGQTISVNGGHIG